MAPIFPRRALAALAALALLSVPAAPPAAAEADALTPAQAEAVRTLVEDLLKRRPEIVIEAIQAFQARQEEAEKAQERKAIDSLRRDLERDEAAPVIGNPDGDVTVVEFMDYRCGYCKQVFPSLQSLLKEDGKIRYVLKEFPVLGEDSVRASRAALAIWLLAPRKYQDYHAALMGNRGTLDEDRLVRFAEALGVEGRRLRETMASEAVDAALKKTFGLAQALGVRGTPAFVVGGRLVPGAVGLDTLRQLVAEARGG